MPRRSTSRTSALRVTDYKDRELLHVIERAADRDGLASSDDIADVLGYSDNGHSRALRVSQRMVWMRRYGFVDRVDPAEVGREHGYALWRITDTGRSIMHGRLPRAVERALDGMDTGTRLMVLDALTRTGYIEATGADAVAMRREWQYNIAQRPR